MIILRRYLDSTSGTRIQNERVMLATHILLGAIALGCLLAAAWMGFAPTGIALAVGLAAVVNHARQAVKTNAVVNNLNLGAT